MNELKIIDIKAIPEDSAFLLDDGVTSIMVDSGFGFTGYRVADKIKEYLGERPLDYIFLTHSHYDHALGSAYALKYWPDAKVVAGTYAASIFRRPEAITTMERLDRSFAKENGVDDYDFLGYEMRTDINVDDGDIVEAGTFRFKAIGLPGHTKCSMGFYEENHKLLISSETLGHYIGETNISPLFLVGVQMAFDSIEKVIKLDPEKILHPHRGLLTQTQRDYFLANVERANREVVDFIIDFIKAGKSDEEIIKEFKDRVFGPGRENMPPEDAVDLNTSIMIKLIKKEYEL